jgi:sigma-E factor negative regulatory protein RseC
MLKAGNEGWTMENSIQESGTVIALEGAQIKVGIKRRAACESCGACGMGGKNELTLLIFNTLEARVGDQVLLELPSVKLYQAALWVYTLPLAMLFVGFWVGQVIGRWLGLAGGQQELAGIIAGFAAIGLTYLGVHRLDRRRQIGARFQPQLVRIINRPEDASL